MSAESEMRVAVVDLRLRIERAATGAVVDSFDSKGHVVEQNRIGARLAFVFVAYKDVLPLPELFGLVRLTRHIYRRSSDVLHGRSNMVNFSPVLLDEWRIVVERLEDLSSKKTKQD